MYLSIGKNAVIRDDELIGIFDLDNCSQSFLTREYLSAAEKAGQVINTAEDIPNSFLSCVGRKPGSKEESSTVYLSQSNSRTLEKRIHQMQTERRNTCRK